MPNWLLYDVCRLHVDYILKAENSFREKHFLSAKFGLNLTAIDARNNKNVHGVTSKEIAFKFMNTLNKTQKEAFYQLYKLDYELFGYSFDEFL